MNYVEILSLLMGGLLVLLAIGSRVGVAFLAVNIVGAILFLGGDPGLHQLARNFVLAPLNFSLAPIPLFIVMGEILFHTGVAFKAIDAVEQMISRVPGRLAVVAIIAGTVFSAISGSTVATTALLGSLLLPRMLQKGYERKTAMGPLLAIGGVDVLIPPSGLTVLFGSLAGFSISDLLLGTTVPGFLMSVVFIGYIVIRAKLHPELSPPESTLPKLSGFERYRPFVVNVLPLVLIFVVVVGGMVGGYATPTEAAGLGAAATILVCALYRSLTWKALYASFAGTVAISGAVLFIVASATTFSQILAFSGATTAVIGDILAYELSPTVIVVLMLLVVLVLGMFIEPASIMLITIPIFVPLVRTLSIDPTWFGVMYMVCMQFGLLTPPFGMLLFTLKSVAPPEVGYGEIVTSAVPYLVLMTGVLLLIFFWPPLVTWLPQIAR